MRDALKLTVYFGESDRVAGRLLSDALVDVFEQHELEAAVLMRAVEGFGVKQRLRTDRFLTLSDDLPLAAVAVDERSRIEAVLGRVEELVEGGLITLERATLLRGDLAPIALPEASHDATKLTIYLGRDERVEGRPAYLSVVDALRAAGLAGATVILGVDGMSHRARRRAGFFSRNEAVPLMLISVGVATSVNAALERVSELLREPIATLERIRVCKRDGTFVARPQQVLERDSAGLAVWQKLMVYLSEQARHGGHPLYTEIIHRLRREGASGATALRGVWGFSGDHPPHGDRLFELRRRVPVVTTVVDTPEAIQRSFDIVDELTGEVGLVTSEIVPAHLAVAPEQRVGGLRLASPAG